MFFLYFSVLIISCCVQLSKPNRVEIQNIALIVTVIVDAWELKLKSEINSKHKQISFFPTVENTQLIWLKRPVHLLGDRVLDLGKLPVSTFKFEFDFNFQVRFPIP